MRLINFIFLVTFLLLLSVYAANAKEKDPEYRKQFHAAEYYFVNDDFGKALPIYKELYAKDTANYNIAMFLGMCYLSLPSQAAKAIFYLEKASKNYTLKTKEQSHKELNANIYSIYFLGYAYQLNYRFDEALQAYNAFLKINEEESDYYNDLARSGVYSCLKAKALLLQIKPCWFDNPGQKINTPADESYPCINRDENLMVFTRATEKKATQADYDLYDIDEQNATIMESRILMSKKKNGHWSRPKDITDQLHANGKCQTVSISADGKRLYLYRDNYAFGSIEDVDNGTIYISHYSKGNWSPIEKLNKNINTMAWETFAIESGDGKKLYFISDKIGGKGGTDIYVSKKTDYGTWGEAEALSGPINTEFDESSIFPVGDTMIYFSSMGHQGIGNLDLFVSKKTDSKEWSEPENLGFPINSPIDDIMFLPTANGMDAYTFFMRTDGIMTTGGSDIYKMELDSDDILADTIIEKQASTTITGTINIGYKKDSSTDLSVNFYTPNNTTIHSAPVDSNRTYTAKLAAGTYQLALEENGYTLYTQRVVLQGEAEKQIDIPTIIHASDSNTYFAKLGDITQYQYATQLSAKYNQVSISDYFSNADGVQEFYCNDKLYRYIIGRYTTEHEADSALAIFKSLGYSDAFTVSTKRIASLLEDKTTEGQIFTVQVFSSHFSASSNMLTGLSDVREVRMSDKNYIYIAGRFSNFDEAQAERMRIKNIGFPDAFVTNISRYKNTKLVK